MPGLTYTPRRAEATVLHRVVRENLETFLQEARARTDGGGLPRFVERELRDFLGCGALARGFVRLRCSDCAYERLIPFSCKGRGFCPSCGGRRMAERAAGLVDEILPQAPVRQWVLTFPHRLRYLLAWNHPLCRAVLAVFVRALLGFYRRRARRAGLAGAQSGTVTSIQRFGAALNLNVHFHTLALDGVFTAAPDGAVCFHPAPPPSDEEVARLLATIRTRVARLLRRRGLSAEGDESGPDPLGEESLALSGISSASVQGRVALGPRTGARLVRIGNDPDAPWVSSNGPRQAHLEGFDLHANLTIGAAERPRLEEVCRYLLRPPVAQDRLHLADDGRVLLELRRPWRDGTTFFVFEPVELLERLAALTPRPRINLVVYHGVLASHARGRERIVSYGRPEGPPAVPASIPSSAGLPPVPTPASFPPSSYEAASATPTSRPSVQRASAPEPPSTTPRPPGRRTWAELMRRTFDLDVLACPRCGGRLRLIATIEDPTVIRKILGHLGLPTEVPEPEPPRSPPLFNIAA